VIDKSCQLKYTWKHKTMISLTNHTQTIFYLNYKFYIL